MTEDLLPTKLTDNTMDRSQSIIASIRSSTDESNIMSKFNESMQDGGKDKN